MQKKARKNYQVCEMVPYFSQKYFLSIFFHHHQIDILFNCIEKNKPNSGQIHFPFMNLLYFAPNSVYFSTNPPIKYQDSKTLIKIL